MATKEPKVEKYITRYKAEELAKEAKKAFGVDKIIVMASLDKEKEYSIDEAKAVINKFKNKEVK